MNFKLKLIDVSCRQYDSTRPRERTFRTPSSVVPLWIELTKPGRAFNRRFRLGTEHYRGRLDRFPSGELSERPKGGARRRRADSLEHPLGHFISRMKYRHESDRVMVPANGPERRLHLV